MNSFADIIDAFGRPRFFADAIGVSSMHARVFKCRDSIPPAYWPAIVRAAKAKNISGITYESLASLAARKREGATG